MQDGVQLRSPVDTLYITFCSMPMRGQSPFLVSFPNLFRKLLCESSEVIARETKFISLRDRRQILLLTLNGFNRTNYIIFPLKLFENHDFFE